MTLVERIFLLRAITPFDRLDDVELALIADAAVLRHYEPGRRVFSRGKMARALIVTLKGTLTDGQGRRLPPVLPTESILSGTPLTSDIVTSSTEGAVCLLINKGHFFTILHECPALMIGFVELCADAAENSPYTPGSVLQSSTIILQDQMVANPMSTAVAAGTTSCEVVSGDETSDRGGGQAS